MKLATTTADFSQLLRDTKSIAAPLRYFTNTPFRHLDLNLSDVHYQGSHWNTDSDAWKAEVEECGATARACGLDFVQSHAPFLPLEDYFREETKGSFMRSVHHCIEACAMLGIPSITVHGVFRHSFTPQEFFEENLRFCRELGETAEKFGVDILIENFENGDFGYYFRTGEEMRRFVETADIPRLHVCWDTGHAHIRGNDQYRDITALGEHLRGLHVHDNFGGADSHVMPTVGTASFDQILRALVEIGYRGSFCFEACDTLRPGDDCHHPRCAYPGDRLTYPPVSLQQTYEGLLYEVGKWMLDSYGIFEE